MLGRADLATLNPQPPAGRTDVIWQSSSGSGGGEPLRIPRSAADIRSIHDIVLGAWRQVIDLPPKRVAMLGGISHTQAALKMRIAGTDFVSFSIDQLDALVAFDPEMISCYPSFARELSASGRTFPSLKAFKLGGERMFRSDLEKLLGRFPGIFVIEQFGSTEMPALAIGVYRHAGAERRLALQAHRYRFHLQPHARWQRLIVEDDFADRLFRIPEPYDTGDEVRMEQGFIVDIRRRDDPANARWAQAEAWLRAGCVNVQWWGEALRYQGEIEIPGAERAPLKRLPHSHKLPLVYGSPST